MHDRTGLEQTLDSWGSVVRTKISVDERAEGGNFILYRMKILDGDRNALKRPCGALHVTRFGHLRLLQRAFSEGVSENVEPFIDNLAARQQGPHQFYR